MRKLIAKMLGKTGIVQPFESDLIRLNEIENGLGKKAVAYVRDGSHETVLSGLEVIDCSSVIHFHRYFKQGFEEDSRSQYIARKAKDPKQLVRYGEVLSRAIGDPDAQTCGSKHVPAVLRVLFYAAGEGLPTAKAFKQNPGSCTLSPGMCEKLCHGAGGSPADLFDIFFQVTRSWPPRPRAARLLKMFDFKPMALNNAAGVVAAGKRIGSDGKIDLLEWLSESRLTATPEIRTFIQDLTGDTAKKVRKKAALILQDTFSGEILAFAKERLENGHANQRETIVDMLRGNQSAEAVELLRQRLPLEKTARIKASIEAVLVSSGTGATPRPGTESGPGIESGPGTEAGTGTEGDAGAEGGTKTGAADGPDSYTAIDGSIVTIPPRRKLAVGPDVRFGEQDRQVLLGIIQKENEAINKRNQHVKETVVRRSRYLLKTVPESYAGQMIAKYNRPAEAIRAERWHDRIEAEVMQTWVQSALNRMAEERAVKFAAKMTWHFPSIFAFNDNSPASTFFASYFQKEGTDFRTLEDVYLWGYEEIEVGRWNKRKKRPVKPFDLLRQQMQYAYSYYAVEDLPGEALWPYLAEALPVFDEAFGLKQSEEEPPNQDQAIRFLARLPKTPKRYFGALLNIAIGTRKSSRKAARDLIKDAPGLVEHVCNLLSDTRQDTRAGAAEWLTALNDKAAIAPLKARLKVEKSDVAMAAILTSLARFGEDLSDHVGPGALAKKAGTILGKAKFDKLEWLVSDHFPQLEYKTGEKVPNDVIRSWIFLAYKLKQPGGNALFDIYLDQLSPAGASALSTWILDAWINYDTSRVSDGEANKRAEQETESRFMQWRQWNKEITREQIHRMIYNEIRSDYQNSGAATKGVLGLTKRADTAHLASTARSYLKVHGKRTSQAMSLLELLAARGEPLALQVLISTATRFRQKGVQAKANELVLAVAEAKDWTMDELADRTVSTAGLNDDGILELTCGPDEKVYTARPDDNFKLALTNPDGKPVKALPAGTDDFTKAAKKQLSASKKELKLIISLQSQRMYEALCAGRVWTANDWLNDLRAHPLTGRLTERVVWSGHDGTGNLLEVFRPTAEGDYINQDDEEVDIGNFQSIQIAHNAFLDEAPDKVWQQHFSDYEIPPLFTQFGRGLLRVEGEQKKQKTITDRKGWMSDTFTIRGIATRLGYERGGAEDGGFFDEYRKSFKGAGLTAVIGFTGNCLPEENNPAALISLKFEQLRKNGHHGQAVELQKVPPVLLSECWNDYRDVAQAGTYDPAWENKAGW